MRLLSTLAAALICLLFAAGALRAQDYKLGNIEIQHPNIAAMIPGMSVASGYVKITNIGKDVDRLVKITSDAAATIQIHDMKMVGEVMKMQELPDGLEIPAGASVELKHGGMHIMLMDLKSPFREGDVVKAKLYFEKAGSIDVEFSVDPAHGAAVHKL
jgi:hypothetical protein